MRTRYASGPKEEGGREGGREGRKQGSKEEKNASAMFDNHTIFSF